MKFFDVIEVDISNLTVTIMGKSKDKKNAEAIRKMAIMNRRNNDNFFAIVAAGKYADGDKYSESADQ